MKKITCVGYHATGSGVIDDLLREFDNIQQGMSDCETRILQDPDGVSDLEFNLIQCPHRLNSSFAIKRFLEYAKSRKRTYSHICGSESTWLEISNKYTIALTKGEFCGFGGSELRLHGSLVIWYYRLKRQWNKRVVKKIFQGTPNRNILPWIKTPLYISISESEFLEKTRDFIDNLSQSINVGDKEFVVLDQLVPPFNTERFTRYVRDLKIVVVDRDPRDVYIYLKKMNDRCLPMDDIHQYCAFWKESHRLISPYTDNTLFVTFEDMIYKYDEMVPKVMSFLGLKKENHVCPKKYFDPNKSIRGTKQWEKHPELAEEMKIIEHELPGFLHKYD